MQVHYIKDHIYFFSVLQMIQEEYNQLAYLGKVTGELPIHKD